MFDFTTLTDDELKLCFKQKREGKYNESPLKFIKPNFEGDMMGNVWLDQGLMEEIARRYCLVK